MGNYPYGGSRPSGNDESFLVHVVKCTAKQIGDYSAPILKHLHLTLKPPSQHQSSEYVSQIQQYKRIVHVSYQHTISIYPYSYISLWYEHTSSKGILIGVFLLAIGCYEVNGFHWFSNTLYVIRKVWLLLSKANSYILSSKFHKM